MRLLMYVRMKLFSSIVLFADSEVVERSNHTLEPPTWCFVQVCTVFKLSI